MLIVLASPAGELTIVSKFFKKWLISSVVLFAFANGMQAGMPLHTEETGRMKCCEKAAGDQHSRSASMARLCCALNCSGPASPSPGFSANLAESLATAGALSNFPPGRPFELANSIRLLRSHLGRTYLPQSAHPRYIQHHRLLI